MGFTSKVGIILRLLVPQIRQNSVFQVLLFHTCSQEGCTRRTGSGLVPHGTFPRESGTTHQAPNLLPSSMFRNCSTSSICPSPHAQNTGCSARFARQIRNCLYGTPCRVPLFHLAHETLRWSTRLALEHISQLARGLNGLNDLVAGALSSSPLETNMNGK